MKHSKTTRTLCALMAAMLLGLLGGCASNTSASSGAASSSAVNSASAATESSSATSADSAASDTSAFTGQYLITAEEALAKIDDKNTVFVDCTGNALLGTVKGAIALVWQDLSTCSAEFGNPGDENWGKIPEPAQLAEILGSYGLDKNKEIICLGHTSTGWGDDGRVAWTLLAAGYENVKFVDGGIDALIAAGAPTQMGGSNPVPCEVEVSTIDKTHVMETDELLANFDTYTIVDTRAIQEYEGATYYGEAKGGHIPGAIHIDYLDLFREDGTLKSNSDITAMFEEAGVSKDDKIVAYCTGGIRSAYMQLVLEMCGFESTTNYDQSFWRWCVVGDVEETAGQQAA